jgi:hypothetical protein
MSLAASMLIGALLVAIGGLLALPAGNVSHLLRLHRNQACALAFPSPNSAVGQPD